MRLPRVPRADLNSRRSMAHDVVIVQSGACALSMKANRAFALTSSVERKGFELPVLVGPSDARERWVSRQISALLFFRDFTRSSHHTARFAVAIPLFQSDHKLDF